MIDTSIVMLDKMENAFCTQCDSPFFEPVHVVKKIPGLLVGISQDQFQLVPLSRCTHCGHIQGADMWVKEKKIE